MMNTSYRNGSSDVLPVAVTAFSYRDMSVPVHSRVMETRQAESTLQQELQQAHSAISAKEIEDLRIQVHLDAVAETERRLGKEYLARSESEAAKIREALDRFQVERKSYFSRVEAEVVRLALAISAKILHREAQVDPLLVTALVRVAVDKLHDGSSVSVRVPPERAEKWRQCLANPLNGSTIAIVEDAHLAPEDCILETDLGSANFSIDSQLKEVEQGFFDLLAQRPPSK
jgi:flagellar assembly protein FliH